MTSLLLERGALGVSTLGVTADLDLKAARITIDRVKGSMSGIYPMSPDTVNPFNGPAQYIGIA